MLGDSSMTASDVAIRVIRQPVPQVPLLTTEEWRVEAQ